MIYIYPANRLENLVILLDRVMQVSQSKNILSEEIILVQSKGMQHWLNLQLAQNRGISMNLGFRLPVQFFWEQIRHILGKDKVPEQSPYSREVLAWRLDALLGSDEVIHSPLCAEPVRYWFNQDTGVGDRDKRFQLAEQLADLFEQYQIYRPDWIESWTLQSAESFAGQQWQALLWQLLIKQIPEHPVGLLRQAINQMAKAPYLPERISLFGINTLPPLWLDFLSALGQHCQVHLFHLNPCVEYWGDIKTDKALAREQIYRWVKKRQDKRSDSDYAQATLDYEQTDNPILANLGAQGREFLSLLQERSSIEIPVYESPKDYHKQQFGEQTSVLQQVQTDILNLRDGRKEPQDIRDNSIVFSSAHSALREIQALHDWLLHQFNNDPQLTPKDVLVMCPNIENYAPYVEAVFAHGISSSVISEALPPLPCSIADRTLKDSEPLVQAFMQCLELPDSRFQVNAILSFLRLPAVQEKFGLTEADIQHLERWLKNSAIHWGLDSEHKQNILGMASCNNKFSWQQGLTRLLLGFAHSDQSELYEDLLLLGDVEGDEALLLGRLFELLEYLQHYAKNLYQPRTAVQWQQVLQQLKNDLFAERPDDVLANTIIQQAINDLGEHTTHADYQDNIPLVVMRDFLQNHFNQPEPGRQFLSGQVTFCSMVPMRSVPFKVIAILGLNDSEFPRHRQPMGFDLMAKEPPRQGDRSRRGDDRYLFLEALISCRETLYLSYQGHDIKTNNIREPSLVLSEFMDYLEKAYGWKLGISHKAEDIFQVPLQAFNRDNFIGDRKSFSQDWLKLSKPDDGINNLQVLPPVTGDDVKNTLALDKLVDFFAHPSRYLAQERLKFFAENSQQNLLDDNEPFVISKLDRYHIQQEIVHLDINTQKPVSDYLHKTLASGQLPDVPDIEQTLLEWQTEAQLFARLIKENGANEVEYKSVLIKVDTLVLEAQLPMSNNTVLLWRLATPKGKDDIKLWLYHLLAQIDCQENEHTYQGAQGFYSVKQKQAKKDKFLRVFLPPVDNPEQELKKLLGYWRLGQEQVLLLNADLGRAHCHGKNQTPSKPMDQRGFNSYWNGSYQTSGLIDDPYIKWFWQGRDIPQWEDELQLEIEAVYDTLYQCQQEEQIEVTDD